jgi:hypothetical protein
LLFPGGKSPLLGRKAGESAENWKKKSWESKISVNFPYFGITLRPSQPVENGSSVLGENLYVHLKSSGKVPRPNSSQRLSTVSAGAFCNHRQFEKNLSAGHRRDESDEPFPA